MSRMPSSPASPSSRLVTTRETTPTQHRPMPDFLSPPERSERMSRIRSKDTKPELFVRRAAWAAGFRYRLHGKGLQGRPDLVFASLRTVVFVHGCFWHGHSCQKGRIPQGNSEFWRAKFAANKLRDRRNREHLKRLGWDVYTVWECSLSTVGKRAATIDRLLAHLERRRQLAATNQQK